MISPSRTITQPTVGFGLARPTPLRARSSAWSMKRMSCEFTYFSRIFHELVKERVGVSFGVERNEIVDLFAGADETNRQAEFARNGDDDAALRGAVELGENDAGDANGRCEFAGL